MKLELCFGRIYPFRIYVRLRAASIITLYGTSIVPFKIITIPFEGENEVFSEETLNQFCLNKKIQSWQAKFFTVEDRAYWTVFIEYEPVLEPDKAKEPIFSEAEQLLYQRLREWRKGEAEQQGVPVYIVANNKELADLVRKAPTSLEALKSIRGFGQKKVERYGKHIIELIKGFYESPAGPRRE